MRSIVICDKCHKEFEISKEMVMTDLVRKIVWCPHCNEELYLDLYKCDPEKNKDCKKTGCYKNGGPCFATWNREYAKEPIKIILHQEMYNQIEKGLEDEKNYK